MTDNEHVFDIRDQYPTEPACVAIEDCPWWVKFKGTREALIATGRFRAEWFPGEPGQRRHTSRNFQDGREVTIMKASPRLYLGFIKHSQAELEAREAHRERGSKLQALQRELDAVPTCEAAYKARLEAQLRELAYMMGAIVCKPSGGYCLDRASRAALAKAAAHLLALANRADVTFNSSARGEELAAIYARHGEGMPKDQAFARFMARAAGLEASEPES